MKKSVAITISDEKLAALEMYLEQKILSFRMKSTSALTACIRKMYRRTLGILLK